MSRGPSLLLKPLVLHAGEGLHFRLGGARGGGRRDLENQLLAVVEQRFDKVKLGAAI